MTIDKHVPAPQLLLCMWLQLNQLLQSEHVILPLAEEPDLIEGLLFYFFSIEKFIIVELQAHELIASHEFQLTVKVRNLTRI